MSGRKILSKLWYIFWEDDSLLSWVINIVVAFVLIKYIIYPGIGLILGTNYPVVAVVSGSMEHKITPAGRVYVMCGKQFKEPRKVDFDFFWQECGDFYRKHNINKLMFNKFPFRDGFNTGDIMVLIGVKPENIKIGDVIVFKANQPDPIIHRVIKITQHNNTYYITTKGDHNSDILMVEKNITEDRILGKAVFRIPYLGYIKIGFVELLKLLGLDTTIGRLFR